MKPFILVSDGMDPDAFKKLSENENFEVYPERKVGQDRVQELLPKINAIVIRSATKMTKDYIDQAPNLKLIIRAGEGTDNIDKAYCEQKGIIVENTPGANNNSAAEHAFALMMTVLRKTAWANHKMINGGWNKELFTGNELWKKTVGIVGFGRIGQILAKRLQGFEPSVLFYDPFVEKSDLPYATKVDTVEEIFQKADIISIHVPLLDQTKGLIDGKMLDLMSDQSILINAARGKIVDENALLERLKQGKIKAAGFDVFETEPLAEDSPLRALDNIVLTPHLGASTEEAQIRVGAMAVDQLAEFFEKDQIVNQVKA